MPWAEIKSQTPKRMNQKAPLLKHKPEDYLIHFSVILPGHSLHLLKEDAGPCLRSMSPLHSCSILGSYTLMWMAHLTLWLLGSLIYSNSMRFLPLHFSHSLSWSFPLPCQCYFFSSTHPTLWLALPVFQVIPSNNQTPLPQSYQNYQFMDTCSCKAYI